VETSLQPVGGDRAASSAAISPAPGWLATWHLLSLDAPTVTVAWTWFVAKATHVALPPIVPAAMFLAVWALYAADRLLDGARGAARDLEARHRFHRRHSRAFRVALATVSLALIPLVLAIPTAMVRLYLGLAALLAAWFLVVHLLGRDRTLTLPKELMPGLFCAAAVFIPIWANLGFPHLGLALAAAAFALLVMLNCLCIYAWEHEELADAHWTTRLGVRCLKQLGVATVLLSLLAIALAGEQLAPIFVATALAAALLLALNHIRETRGTLEPTDLRAAADLVLLTPLLVAPFLR
jgi:hypothetical protein